MSTVQCISRLARGYRCRKGEAVKAASTCDEWRCWIMAVMWLISAGWAVYCTAAGATYPAEH